jgi:hypothetical protein
MRWHGKSNMGAMVVVDQRERSRHLLVPGFPCPPHKHISDQLPHGFASRSELLLLAILVEEFQQVAFYGYRNTHDVRHALTSNLVNVRNGR